jgi:hypothetical protein
VKLLARLRLGEYGSDDNHQQYWTVRYDDEDQEDLYLNEIRDALSLYKIYLYEYRFDGTIPANSNERGADLSTDRGADVPTERGAFERGDEISSERGADISNEKQIDTSNHENES